MAEYGPNDIDDSSTGNPERDARDEVPLAINVLTENKTRRTLLDYFLTQAEEDAQLSKAAIVRETGLARQSVVDNVDELVKFDVVDDVGNKQSRYSLNLDSDVFELLHVLNEELAANYLDDNDSRENDDVGGVEGSDSNSG